ncbi:MAG: hypothetical protein ISEC1_P0783 [Thiomicrorhabdus sp.]|nr:MAG: hypothetical protein ISEC1_P0783 [Thiomicrorhabdus sp.]
MDKEYFLSLRTQYENLGDFLIAQATVNLLSQSGNLTLDIRDVPSDYLALFKLPENVRKVKAGFAGHVLKNRDKNWCYVVKPGGYSVANSSKDTVKLLLMGVYFRLLKAIASVKVTKMPHSLFGKVCWADKFYSNSFDTVFCRDKLTLDNYKKAEIQNILLAPDMAMFFVHEPSIFKADLNEIKDSVAISLRYDRLSDEVDSAQALASKICSEQNLLRVSFISQVMFDDELNTKTAQLMNASLLNYTLDSQSIKSISTEYARSKYVISNRLHSLLLGVINGAIPIAVIDPQKDQKIIGCLEDLGIEWFPKDQLKNLDVSTKSLSQENVDNRIISFKKALQY